MTLKEENFEIVNAKRIYAEQLAIVDKDGGEVFVLGLEPDGKTPRVDMYCHDKAANPADASVSLTLDAENGVLLAFRHEDKEKGAALPLLKLGLAHDGTATVRLFDKDGKPVAGMTNTDTGIDGTEAHPGIVEARYFQLLHPKRECVGGFGIGYGQQPELSMVGHRPDGKVAGELCVSMVDEDAGEAFAEPHSAGTPQLYMTAYGDKPGGKGWSRDVLAASLDEDGTARLQLGDDEQGLNMGARPDGTVLTNLFDRFRSERLEGTEG